MKRSTQGLALCAVAAVALGGVVLTRAVDAPRTTGPTTAPATRPSSFVSRTTFPPAKAALPATRPAVAVAPTIPAPLPLSEPYKMVVTRTIFSRVRTTWVPGSGPTRGGTPSSQPAQPPVHDGAYLASSPEYSIGVKGVSLEDGLYIAFLEDSNRHETAGVHVGEYVAHGQITAMSLAGIDYVTGGKTRNISIGQTLDGKTLPSAAPNSFVASKTAWPAATSGDTGGRDFRPRDAGSTDGQRDFRQRDNGSADAPRDSRQRDNGSSDSPRDFRARDSGSSDSPRDFRQRDNGSAPAASDPRSRDSGGDQRAQTDRSGQADRGSQSDRGGQADRGGQSDQRSDQRQAATEQRAPAPPDQLDSGFDPGAFGPP